MTFDGQALHRENRTGIWLGVVSPLLERVCWIAGGTWASEPLMQPGSEMVGEDLTWASGSAMPALFLF